MVDNPLTIVGGTDAGDESGGAPPHIPTEATRARVCVLAEAGVGQRGIAADIGIAVNTLRKHYMVELIRTDAKVQAAIGQATLQEALGAPAVYDQAGNLLRAEIRRNPVLLMFLCKSRLGFRDGGPGQIDRGEVPNDDGLEYGTYGLTERARLERITGLLNLAGARRAGRAANGASPVGTVPAKPTGNGSGERS